MRREEEDAPCCGVGMEVCQETSDKAFPEAGGRFAAEGLTGLPHPGGAPGSTLWPGGSEGGRAPPCGAGRTQRTLRSLDQVAFSF